MESQGEENDVNIKTQMEMTPTELNEGVLESSQSNVDNGKAVTNESREHGKNSDNLSQILFSEATEDTTVISKNSDNNDSTSKPKKRQLGMMGPAFTISKLSVNLSDVSVELNISKEQSVVETGGKGFDARSLMQQHYDYRHTNKPKHFVCGTCQKSYELKKSLDEHNMRLHSKGSYKF